MWSRSAPCARPRCCPVRWTVRGWTPTRCAAWIRRRAARRRRRTTRRPPPVDVSPGEPAKAINQRSDVTAVPAAGVVAEAMVALVLADAAAEKFGGDSLPEVRRNHRGYLDSLVIA